MGPCICYCLEKTYLFLQALGAIPLDTLTDSPAYLLGLRNHPLQACSMDPGPKIKSQKCQATLTLCSPVTQHLGSVPIHQQSSPVETHI